MITSPILGASMSGPMKMMRKAPSIQLLLDEDLDGQGRRERRGSQYEAYEPLPHLNNAASPGQRIPVRCDACACVRAWR